MYSTAPADWAKKKFECMTFKWRYLSFVVSLMFVISVINTVASLNFILFYFLIDFNQEVLRIPQSSSTAGTSPSDCLVSFPGHSLGFFYPSAEVQSVYSTAPAAWAIHSFKCQTVLFQIIQFSISTQFRRQKQFYFEQLSSARSRSSNVKTVLF